MYVIIQSKIFTFEKTNVSIVFFNTIPPKKKKELAIAGKLFLFLCPPHLQMQMNGVCYLQTYY